MKYSMLRLLKAFCINIVLMFTCAVMAQASDAPSMRGVNIAGGEFAPGKLPGVYNKDYIYPSAANISTFADLGMNTIRVPFLWERMQPKLNEALDQQELARLDAVVALAKARHMMVIIDPHNYAKYQGALIGSEEVPLKAFIHLWVQLAKHYKDEPLVVFGLMNEPNKQSAEQWAGIAQAAIDAIRSTGARQLILVPGTKWTGAHSWKKKAGNLSNAEALAGIKDSDNNIAIEVHQYFDADYSGRSAACVSAEVGEAALTEVTAWLKATGHKGFLAEFGASDDPVCLEALKNTLNHMQKNADVWKGWTYWAAGSWLGKYIYSIQPPDETLHPQVSVLKKFLY